MYGQCPYTQDQIGDSVTVRELAYSWLIPTGTRGNEVAAPLPTGQTSHMQPSDIDFSNLSTAERIQLAEDLWDSVAAETGGLPLTAAQQAELDRRLADMERDPGAGDSWETVRARIESRLDKAG